MVSRRTYFKCISQTMDYERVVRINKRLYERLLSDNVASCCPSPALRLHPGHHKEMKITIKHWHSSKILLGDACLSSVVLKRPMVSSSSQLVESMERDIKCYEGRLTSHRPLSESAAHRDRHRSEPYWTSLKYSLQLGLGISYCMRLLAKQHDSQPSTLASGFRQPFAYRKSKRH
jgi:hypothetical protein